MRNPTTATRSKRRRGQEGYVLVTVAILLIVIVGFAAMAVDFGVLYSSRTTAQRIADSASFSGASTFILNPLAQQPETAVQYALNTATSQQVLGRDVQAAEVEVDVDLGQRIVTVQLTRTEPTFLARALAIDSADIRVRAAAQAARNATGSSCAKPWFVPNSIFLSDPLPPGSVLCDACDPTHPLSDQLLIKNGEVTPYALSRIGDRFPLKPQRPEGALEPGQFYAIQLGAGSGAAVYRSTIAGCAPTDVFCHECYSVEPGNMVGPTIQGVRDLIGDPPDDFHAVGEYGPDRVDTSPSLIVSPIWDICTPADGGCPATSFCPDGSFAEQGANINLRVVGFAMLFLEGVQGNDVVARFIGVGACGGGGGGDDGGGQVDQEPGAFSFPIRLVQPTSSDE